MIIVMENGATDAQIEGVVHKIKEFGLDANVSRGTERTVIGAIGDERKLDQEMIDALPGVENSMHIVKPYKIVAREWHKQNTVIDIKGIPLGGNQIQIIGGPCSVETHGANGSLRHVRQRGRLPSDARWRLQAAHQSLHLPRQGRRRPGHVPQGGGQIRPAHRHGIDGRAHAGYLPRIRCGRDPDRHAQYAKFRLAERSRRASTSR